jgi:hypothetical protein
MADENKNYSFALIGIVAIVAIVAVVVLIMSFKAGPTYVTSEVQAATQIANQNTAGEAAVKPAYAQCNVFSELIRKYNCWAQPTSGDCLFYWEQFSRCYDALVKY